MRFSAERIRLLAPGMTSAMIRVAELVLNRPDAAATLSIGQLAELSGTSPSTVTRFCRRVGFRDLAEMRAAIAIDIGRNMRPEDVETSLYTKWASDSIAAEILATLESAVRANLASGILDILADHIILAGRVALYSDVESAFVADHVRTALHLAGIEVEAS